MNMGKSLGLVDIGNTSLKLKLFETGSAWHLTPNATLYWAYPQDQLKPYPAEWGRDETNTCRVDDLHQIKQFLCRYLEKAHTVESIQWRVSSVQPLAMKSFLRVLADIRPHDLVEVILKSDVPLACDVDFPDQVGIDRLLSAFGAKKTAGLDGPLVVIQAGTAITVDWIDERGVFCGGAIMPGVALTLKYLALGTSSLPWLATPSDVTSFELPGRNTQQAMQAGVNASFLGGLQLLLSRYRTLAAKLGLEPRIFMSGGDGPALSRALNTPIHFVPDLVLQSLAMLPLSDRIGAA